MWNSLPNDVVEADISNSHAAPTRNDTGVQPDTELLTRLEYCN